MQAHDEGVMLIDGAYGEGGGQILRTSLALSAIFKKPIAIRHIRAKRNNPGLRHQHLACVEALARITRGRVEGAELGSEAITFVPREILPGNHRFQIGNGKRSAGAVTLLLQTLLLPLCVGSRTSHLTLIGGTHVPWSPPFHYLSEVFLPSLSSFGISVNARIERWGWYPKGGGMIWVEITAVPVLEPVVLLERGPVKKIHGLSASSQLPKHVAERQRDYALRRLKGEMKMDSEIDILREVPGDGPGSFIFLVVESEKGLAGFSSLGMRGKKAEDVAREAVDSVKEYIESGACIDSHLADQLLPFMALARGRSSFTTHRITQHLVTNLWVIQQFANVEINLQGEVGGKGKVEVACA
jgi:RNA 3'-terminal phosphate cyclase (ATP)